MCTKGIWRGTTARSGCPANLPVEGHQVTDDEGNLVAPCLDTDLAGAENRFAGTAHPEVPPVELQLQRNYVGLFIVVPDSLHQLVPVTEGHLPSKHRHRTHYAPRLGVNLRRWRALRPADP